MHEPLVVRLVATAGPDEGRGHVGRALALAEALAKIGIHARLQLIRGTLTALDLSRAMDLGTEVVAGRVVANDAATVIDLPDPNARDGEVDPRRLIVFDDMDLFAGHAAAVVQPSQPRWRGRGSAERVLQGYAFAPITSAYPRLRSAARPVQAPTGGSASSPASAAAIPHESRIGSLSPWHQVATGAPNLSRGSSYAGPVDVLSVDVVRDPADLPERLASADVVVLGAGR